MEAWAIGVEADLLEVDSLEVGLMKVGYFGLSQNRWGRNNSNNYEVYSVLVIVVRRLRY